MAALAVAACDATAGPGHTVVDSFANCHVGMYFADCGGEGAPVLGCDAERDESCWWFTTGAVPREITLVSDCPPEDVCCHDDWPFAEPTGLGAYRLLFALDRAPWDRTREMNVDVVVDAALVAPATPTLTCEGALPDVNGVGPCGDLEGVIQVELDTPALRFVAPGNYYGWVPTVELDAADGAAPRARVCLHDYTDSWGNDCPDAVATCATGGTVTIDAWPLPAGPGAIVSLDVAFAGGARLLADAEVTYVRERRAP